MKNPQPSTPPGAAERGTGNRNPTFTVFTATWNRAHALHGVYRSLEQQSFRDFEWVIVDDGSTDNTSELVEGWHKQASFPIRFYRQRHAGKHVAFNRGVKEARGHLFVSIDSDDVCVPRALERFWYHWQSISCPERYFGVAALAQDERGRLIGTRFPRKVLDSDASELRYRYKVVGDKWTAMRTDVLRAFPFPEVEGLLYIPGAIIWAEIAKHYKTRFVNEVLLTCHPGDRSNPGERQDLVPRAAGAAGDAFWHLTVLNRELDWFCLAPLQFLKSAVLYVRFSCYSCTGLMDQYRALSSRLARLLWILGLPLGLWLCHRDRRCSLQRDSTS